MLEIRKNALTIVRAELSEYQGLQRVDVREFLNLDGNGYRATKKGINLPITAIPELRAALQDLEAEALSLGHLEAEHYEAAGLHVPRQLLEAS